MTTFVRIEGPTTTSRFTADAAVAEIVGTAGSIEAKIGCLTDFVGLLLDRVDPEDAQFILNSCDPECGWYFEP